MVPCCDCSGPWAMSLEEVLGGHTMSKSSGVAEEVGSLRGVFGLMELGLRD